MQLQVTVPGLLAEFTGGRRRLSVEASTLREALGILLRQHPGLRPHLYDERMCLRPHVLIFLNEVNIATLPEADANLRAGDRLRILQAVSGG